MARNPVTESDVAAAKQQLEAANQNVSVASIIAHLGRGSSSTVTPLLRKIREQAKADAPPPKTGEPVPEDVIAKLTDLAKANALAMYQLIAEPVAALARSKDLEVAAERKDMQAEVDQALAELAQATSRIGELEGQASRSTSRIAELTERLAGVEEASRVATEHHTAAARTAAEYHAEELARERTQRAEATDLMRQQIEQLRDDLTREREASGRVAARNDELSLDLQEARTRYAAQQQATATAQQEHRAEADQHQRTRDALTEARSDLTRERSEHVSEREGLRLEARTQAETLRASEAALRERLESALAEAAELRGRMAALIPPPSNEKTS